MIINYVTGLAGSAKTHSAVTWSLQEARKDAKIMFAQPTKELNHETLLMLKAQGCSDVKITVINSDDYEERVKRSIISHLIESAAEETGEILLITQSAWLTLPHFQGKEKWMVIVDEIPMPVFDISRNIPENHHYITNNLILQDFNQIYSSVEVKNRSELDKFRRNVRQDRMWNVLMEPISFLLSPNHTCYIHNANYKNILELTDKQSKQKDEELSKEDIDKKYCLIMFAQLEPRAFAGYKDIIIMGAMFKESLIYNIWSNQGIKFKEFEPISKLLRYHSHTNGKLIDIIYLWNGVWSKTFRDMTVKDTNKTVWQYCSDYAINALGDDPYIYIVNKDVNSNMKRPFSTGQEVSSVCHGLNKYQDINNIVFLSALNPAPQALSFIDMLGVNVDETRRALYLQSLYQAIMRTSIRNPDNNDRKKVIVMDKEAADYLHVQFPGSTIVRADQMPFIPKKQIGRPQIYRDDQARNTALDMKRRIVKAARDLAEKKVNTCPVSIIANIYAKDFFHQDFHSNRELMKSLEEAAKFETEEKGNNILICPAVFTTNKAGEIRRCLDNIEYINGVWLDKDEGDLTKEDFRRMFPNLWYACYSTFKNNGRFRIFIPTKSVMDMETDKLIKNMIFDVIESYGFAEKKIKDTDKTHGFDTGKKAASSLFYLPCKRKGDPDAFFDEMSGSELDPIAWLENPTRNNIYDPPPKQDETPNLMAVVRARLIAENKPVPDLSERVDQERSKYLAIPIGNGQRNLQFFALGARLRKIGLNYHEIEQVLKQTGQDNERQKQIPSIIRSLKKKEVLM